MKQQLKKKKPKTKAKVQIADLKPKKGVKGGDGPTENVSLNYGRIQYRY